MTDDRLWLSLLDGAGRLRIDAVNKLSMANLSTWLGDVLRGDQVATGADRDESPVELLTRTYHRLDPWVRQTFQDILLEFLSELVRAPDSRWKTTAAEHLLLLVAAVFPGMPTLPRAIDLLRFIVDTERDSAGSAAHPVPVFALKCLIALGHRTAPAFWLRQYDRRGARAAGPVLRGLALWDLASPFVWLADNAHDRAATSALRAALPLLVEKFSAGPIREQLARLVPRLSGDDAAALARTCKAIGIGDPLGPPDGGSHLRSDVLAASLARDVDAAGLSQLSAPGELREQLEAKLCAIDAASDDPTYVRALLFLANSLLDTSATHDVLKRLLDTWRARKPSINHRRRDALVQLIEELDRVAATPEVSFRLQAFADLLRHENLNVVSEFDRIASSWMDG
jgi:hypothetical protein